MDPGGLLYHPAAVMSASVASSALSYADGLVSKRCANTLALRSEAAAAARVVRSRPGAVVRRNVLSAGLRGGGDEGVGDGAGLGFVMSAAARASTTTRSI
jgi:hypothetical protein